MILCDVNVTGEKMDDFSFLEPLFQATPEHARLFKVFKTIATNVPLLRVRAYLTNTLYLLENTSPTFIDRRSDDLFAFLIDKLSTNKTFSEDEPVCEVSAFSHSIAFPFQRKSVVGFFLCLSGMRSQGKEFVDALCRCHVGVSLVKNSKLLIAELHNNRTLFYFELQKAEGALSQSEIQDLQSSLEELGSFTVAKCKAPIPSLESSAKTLRWLMKEFEKGDLPHVMIDVGVQTDEKLNFFVFVCQFIDGQTSALHKQPDYPDLEVECQFREDLEGGIKEGVVFKIALPNAPSPWVEKRQQISRLIEKYVGPFRDVNGGLLEKIEQNFEALSKICPDPSKRLRGFFDSIYPESERAICNPALLKTIYLAAQTEEGYTLLDEADAVAAIIKAEKGFAKTWKEALSKQFPKAGFAETFALNMATVSCFLHHPSPKDRKLFKKETEALFQKWAQIETHETLRLCTTFDFTSFDPRTGAEEGTSYLHKMLFEGLMRIGPDGNAEPAIAEKVSISRNKLRYKFHLRKSQWSNGMLLTAHDFLYSWTMILTQKRLAPLNYLFDVIENAEEVKRKKLPPWALGVNVIDDYTLEVQLRSPFTPFLEISALTLFSPICQAIDKKHPGWIEAAGNEYVCNGPFCLEKKEDKGNIILKKNSFYWEAEKTRLERITIPLVSREKGEKLFLNKQVDALLNYFYINASALNMGDAKVTQLRGTAAKRFLYLNCLKPPFRSKKMRQAIAFAMDRQQIVRAVPYTATPSLSFYSSFHSQNSKNIRSLQNIQKAQNLFIEALGEDPEIRTTFFNQTISVLEGAEDLAIALCERINRVFSANWSVSILKVNLTEYCREGKKGQIAIGSWIDRPRDPGYFLGIFRSEDNPTNLSCWTHPQMQSIIEQLNVVKNLKERKQLLKNAEALLFEEIPMIPLLDVEYPSLCHAQVKEIYANPLQQFDVRHAFKQQSSNPKKSGSAKT